MTLNGYWGKNLKAVFALFAHRFKVFLHCMIQIEIHVVFLNDNRSPTPQHILTT